MILLMFGVGLHFSAADLMAVRRIAVPGAIGQIIIATAIGMGTTTLWGWSFGAGLVLGLSLSVASTVVMLRALEERNAIETPHAHAETGAVGMASSPWPARLGLPVRSRLWVAEVQTTICAVHQHLRQNAV